MKTHAIIRDVSPAIAKCELTHLERAPIDADRAAAEHEAYARALEALGCELERLPAEPDLPDSVFVEDTAVVLPELAVITRPGAASRRPETASIAGVLGRYRPLRTISEPGTLDGGDVLRIERDVYVGLTERTNAEGVSQLEAFLRPLGYTVRAIPVAGCLHLKSAASWLGGDTVLLNPHWVDTAHFAGLRCIEVHPEEPHAANALRLGDTLICGAAPVRTHQRLEEAGFRVWPVAITELAKAEAGVTCSSLILEAAPTEST